MDEGGGEQGSWKKQDSSEQSLVSSAGGGIEALDGTGRF